jgi:hypothetical protein
MNALTFENRNDLRPTRAVRPGTMYKDDVLDRGGTRGLGGNVRWHQRSRETSRANEDGEGFTKTHVDLPFVF